MKKRIFSRLMAMLMALALLATNALAVDLNQAFVEDESNWSEEYGRKYITLTDSEYTVTEDITTDRTLKFSHPDGNGYGLPQFETTLDLKGHTIDHGGTDGSVIQVARYITLTIKDTSEDGTGTITGGNNQFGGGIYVGGGTVKLESGNITGNKACEGGGVGSGGDGTLIMSGGSITDNEAENAGAVYLYCGGRAEITGGIITGNIATKQDQWSDALYDGIDAWTGSISGDAAVCGNGVDGKGINVYWGSKDNAQQAEPCYHHYLPATCTEPSKCKGCGDTQGEPLGHTPSTPVRENEIAASAGITGSYDEVVYCTECGEELNRNTHTTPALPMPVDFGEDFTGGTGTGAGTTIDDEETPLAGILTLADLLNALYEYEGIEAVELPEDFQWADHVYAQAIHWGLSENLVVDAEDDPLDPDELLTVALLREVLVNFVEHKGIDFTVTLDGEDEDLVLDLGERLAAFYPELEKALTKKAA